MKRIKLIALALLSVVLVAMPALAGQVVTSTLPTVAYEILGAARNLSLDGVRPVGITLGNTLQNSTVVTMTLSGGAVFTPAQTYYLCANNTAATENVVQVASGTAAAVNTILPLPITGLPVPPAAGANVALGQAIWLTTNAACNYASGAFNYVLTTGTSVGSASLSGNVTLAGTTTLMDTFSANNVALISRQYTTNQLNTATLVAIDYITGSADGTKLVAATPGTNVIGGSTSLNVASAITITPAYNVPSNGGSFNQVLTLTDSHGDWAGLSRVFVVGGSDCTAAAAANSSPLTGATVTLNYPNAANAASNTTLCVNVAGNVSIPSRTISGSYAYVAVTSTSASALNLPASGSSFIWQVWAPNGYQAFNPYMYVGASQDATYDMFCRFYNTSSQTAQVFVDVYPAGVAGGDPVRFTLTSIGPNSAQTYWGSNIGELASIPVGSSYAALFTITAPPAQVNGVSFFKRASSGDRQLPLYKSVKSTDTYLSE